MTEPQITVSLTEGSWTCFHCGFSTSDRAEAQAHFGDEASEPALCLTWSNLNRNGRKYLLQDTIRQLNAEREETFRLRQQVEMLEYQVNGQEAAISCRFKGCRTIQEAWCQYDSMEGRALAAEEKLAKAIQALEKIIPFTASARNTYDSLQVTIADLKGE